MQHELLRFPPVLQLALLGLLAAYVVLSLLARVSPGFRWLWRDRADAAMQFLCARRTCANPNARQIAAAVEAAKTFRD